MSTFEDKTCVTRKWIFSTPVRKFRSAWPRLQLTRTRQNLTESDVTNRLESKLGTICVSIRRLKWSKKSRREEITPVPTPTKKGTGTSRAPASANPVSNGGSQVSTHESGGSCGAIGAAQHSASTIEKNNNVTQGERVTINEMSQKAAITSVTM